MSFRRILLSAAVLVILGTWSFLSRPFPDAAEMLASPDRYVGEVIYGFNETRTVSRAPDGFVAEQYGTRLNVIWEADDIPLNCLVDMRGRFEAPDRFRAEVVRFMEKRPLKIVVSIIPALLCLPFALLAVRWDHSSRGLKLKGPKRRA